MNSREQQNNHLHERMEQRWTDEWKLEDRKKKKREWMNDGNECWTDLRQRSQSLPGPSAEHYPPPRDTSKVGSPGEAPFDHDNSPPGVRTQSRARVHRPSRLSPPLILSSSSLRLRSSLRASVYDQRQRKKRKKWKRRWPSVHSVSSRHWVEPRSLLPKPQVLPSGKLR